jgi:hypothetical protein
VHEEVGAPTVFYQVSTQEDFRGKIRHTVKRLRESGRDPRNLVYVTSRTVSMPDAEERALTRELGVAVQIRDAKFIMEGHCHDRNRGFGLFPCLAGLVRPQGQRR